jgi:hypothetical protein
MIEKDYYAAVSRFYTRNSGMSMAIEVKITKAKALPFRCLLPHQEENLLQSERTFAYKIPDAGMGRKPYDIMLVHRARAVIVAVYYRRATPACTRFPCAHGSRNANRPAKNP